MHNIIFIFIGTILGLLIGFLCGKLSSNKAMAEIAKYKEQINSKDETIKTLQDMQKLVKEQFTNIANQTILEKQSNLNEQNSKLLEPLSKNLESFRIRMEEFSKEGATNTQTIKTQIETLINENKVIKNTANELTNALKENSQSRGAFGEIILENVLKASGLKNINEYGECGNYITQSGYRDLNNPSAPLIRPDAVIFFPDNKNIIVDSKLALNDFMEFANSQDEEEKGKYLKDFYSQVEKMVNELGDKYNNLDGLQTPDFKLMFIPLEGIMSYIVSNQKLIEHANSKNVIIVGPSTLLAALRIINYCWAQKNQAENIAQILKTGESIYAKCAVLIEKLEVLKNKFTSTEAYFDEIMKPLTGKGGLTSLVDKFRNFGLNPAKKISEKYLPDAENTEDEEESVL
ncbi:MAG: DNA recombination protein RmuC [bacterium]|nr:DNA recombination protein RmuC [bacterium]